MWELRVGSLAAGVAGCGLHSTACPQTLLTNKQPARGLVGPLAGCCVWRDKWLTLAAV